MRIRRKDARDNVAERRSCDDADHRGDHPGAKVDPREVEAVEERSAPPTPIIYEVIRKLGQEEMERPAISLWWSGLAAGLSISFSLLAQAILHVHLPDLAWKPLVTSFGYSIGFLMVVLSRQQLFTENTLTVVLPVMAQPSPRNFALIARIWSIALAGNLAGTLFAALFCTFTPVLTPELKAGMMEISRHLLGHGWLEMFFKAISAGFLVAAMVWMIPAANTAQFHIVTLMSYLIAAGGFMHIVAGSVEAFLLVANGELSPGAMVVGFLLPVLSGNIVGGTALFALISYAQVMDEI